MHLHNTKVPPTPGPESDLQRVRVLPPWRTRTRRATWTWQPRFVRPQRPRFIPSQGGLLIGCQSWSLETPCTRFSVRTTVKCNLNESFCKAFIHISRVSVQPNHACCFVFFFFSFVCLSPICIELEGRISIAGPPVLTQNGLDQTKIN